MSLAVSWKKDKLYISKFTLNNLIGWLTPGRCNLNGLNILETLHLV